MNLNKKKSDNSNLKLIKNDSTNSTIKEIESLDSIIEEIPSQSDLTKSKLRFLVLLLACLAGFGCYYVHDNPAPLELELERVIKT